MSQFFSYIYGLLFQLITIPIRANNAFCLIYLCGPILVTAYVFSRTNTFKWGNFLKFLFPDRFYRHKENLVNLGMLCLNVVLRYIDHTSVPVVVAILLKKQLIDNFDIPVGLLSQFSEESVGYLFYATGTLIILLVRELGFYIFHYLSHNVDFLFEFHKVHHSSVAFTPISVMREHPIEFFFRKWVMGICEGVAYVLFFILFGQKLQISTIFGVSSYVFLFYITYYHLLHSHVWLKFGGVWDYILNSPAHHQIHHSTNKEHWDKNYGGLFVIYDYIFGTLCIPPEKIDNLQFGLNGDEEKQYSSFAANMTLPLIKIAKNFR